MAEAGSVAIAKEVARTIEAARLSQPVVVERSYADWELPLEDADDANRVDVVAVTTEQKAEVTSRGMYRLVVPVDVAVRRRFDADYQHDDTGRVLVDTVDSLCRLVQEIALLFTQERLQGFQSGVWNGTRIVVCPLVKHLRELKQFTGIIRVEFFAHVEA